MDQVDDAAEDVGVGLGQDAPAQVEHVAGPAGVGVEHGAGGARPRCPTGARHTVGSRLPCTATSGPRRARARSSGTRQSTPTTSAPASCMQLQQLAGAHAEVDAGHAQVGQPGTAPCGWRAARGGGSRPG